MGEKRPFQERARIKTPSQIEGEIEKIYRGLVAGKIAPAKAKSRIDALNTLFRIKSDNQPSGSAGELQPGIGNINIIAIPSGWAVVPLLGLEASMPVETYHKLKKMLPGDAFTPLIPSYLPPPIEDNQPMLRMLDGGRDAPELELPPAV